MQIILILFIRGSRNFGELYLIGKVNTPTVPLSKDKKAKSADAKSTEVGILPLNSQPGDLKPMAPAPKEITITDSNFSDGTNTNTDTTTTPTPAPTLDLNNKTYTIKDLLKEYTSKNGDDYKKTYNELVCQLKENSGDEKFVRSTIERLLGTFSGQYDKKETERSSRSDIAKDNSEVLKIFLNTPNSDPIPHAICGPIHEFGMKLLNDAGYDATVLGGENLNVNKDGHYTLLYRLKDKEYVYDNYGSSVKVQADNMIDAAKNVMSDYENQFSTQGNVSIQGKDKGTTYTEYFAKDEALFGQKIDKNTNRNILIDNQDVKNFMDYKNTTKKYKSTESKTITYGAEKNLNSQLINFSLKNENNNLLKSKKEQLDIQAGAKNTSSRYYDKANDKAIDAKYQIQKNNVQFSSELIASDLNLEKTTKTLTLKGYAIEQLLNNKGIVGSNAKSALSESFLSDEDLYNNNRLKTNIKTLSTNVELKKFFDTDVSKKFKITPWAGARINAYGTRVKSDIIYNDYAKVNDVSYSYDGRISLAAGANAQYKTNKLNLKANAAFQQIGDAALNNVAQQKLMLKQGNIKEVSFGADYKFGKNTISGNAAFASVNSKNLYNKTILNSALSFETENIANSGITATAYTGFEQNSANLNMSSVKENIEKEKRYYIGAEAEKQTNFGSIKAGVQYDKYTEGFKEGKNKGLSANVSLIYKF